MGAADILLIGGHYRDTVTDILAMAPLLAGLNVEVFGGIALNGHNGV